MNTNPIPRPVLTFVRYKIVALIAFGRQVVVALTGNTNYTTPVPSLTAVTTAVDALETANEDAMHGDRLAISRRKDARLALVNLLRLLAAYVDNQGQQDRTILMSSGFELVRVPAPIGPLQPPNAPTLRRGKNDGQIKARVTRQNGIISVNWRIALASAPTVYLETVSTAAARYLFTGLAAGQIYLVQASVVGTAGTTSWGPTSALMAL
jgi:hypothetical protein